MNNKIIMKYFFLLQIIICINFQTLAQCPARHVEINWQNDIDEFARNYPNCTVINGKLSIYNFYNTDLDLSGLQNIVRIEENLEIDGDSGLTSFYGLHNVKTINGDLIIKSCDRFKDLIELQNIETIKGGLTIERNDSLINLNGLQKITSFGGTLNIQKNKALVNLEGLDNVDKVGGSVRIDENKSLESLKGIQNINTIEMYLSIRNNDLLQNLDEFTNLKNIGGLGIVKNSALMNIEGLLNVSDTLTQLVIYENDNISSIEALKNITFISEWMSISENKNLNSLKGLEGITWVGDYLIIENNDKLITLIGLQNIKFVGGYLKIDRNSSLKNLNGLENITEIGGSLSVDGRDLENLDPLSNLMKIGEYISIGGSNTQSLSFLHNIKNISGYLFITGNRKLTNLDGLQNITSIDGYLHINQNNDLVDLSKLQNLTSIGGYLKISSNNDLPDLNGLENLTYLGSDLEIRYNDALNDISGLSGITSISGELTIEHNPLLSNCNTNNVCNFLVRNYDYSNKYIITENGYGCNTAIQILDDCNEASRIYAYLYFDINQNKIRDINEPLISKGNITIDPINTTIFPDPVNGFFQYIVLPGEYTFKLNQATLPNWSLTTDSIQYTLSLEKGTTATVEFGIYPNELVSNMYTFINSPNNRCNDTIPFQISTYNAGTTISSGLLWFHKDSLIAGYEFVDDPDTIIEPNQLGWYFEDLAPGRKISKSINLIIPGPPNFELGDLLHYTSYGQYNDINGNYSSTPFKYSAEIRCAYDPNDKLVNPQRFCDYTLFEDTLIYTIRFQNTGNDFAKDVIIRDTLDVNLNLDSFTLLGSSHPNVLNASILKENRLATFEFNVINLPDSTSNLEDSQGYVSYMILPKNGLAENTIIKNSSGIYFDLNPPILTNTVQNILVNKIPNTTWCADNDNDGLGDAMNMLESCEQPAGYVADCTDLDDIVSIINYALPSKVDIYPNPSPGTFQIMFEELSFNNTTFSIYNSAGAEVVSRVRLRRSNQIYNYSHLPNGVYYINIKLDDEAFIQKKLLVLK